MTTPAANEPPNDTPRRDDAAPDGPASNDAGSGEPLSVEPSGRTPRVDRPSLLSDFTEDEVESIEVQADAVPAKKRRSLDPDAEIPEGALGAPGRLGWRVPLVAGSIAMLAAVVFAAVYPPTEVARWKSALRQLVDAPLYAWIGVGAVLACARFLERPFGGIQYVVARMVFPVGVFVLFWQGSHALVVEQAWPAVVRWPIAVIPGAAVYYGWTRYSLRLDRSGAGILAGLHLVAWFVLVIFRAVS